VAERGILLALAVAACMAAPPDEAPVDGRAAAVDARPPAADAGPRRCKRGVSYNREDGADGPALSPGVGWWYNWSPFPGDGSEGPLGDAGLEFVPMIWTGPPRAGIDTAFLIEHIPAGAKYLLGFNEPNFGVQASLTPQQAAAAWPQLEEIARARNLQLVSPALNYCGGDCNETDPFVWLDAFFAACRGCRIDHVAFHWYACTRDALRHMIERFGSYGKPLWLTEFACMDQADTSQPVQERYMRESLAILEADTRIFRYAWFIGRSVPGASTWDLLGAPGRRTPLGDTYVGFDDSCEP
jgi:hypothetical protein